MRFLLTILLFISTAVGAQSLNQSQQKALNDAVEFLNKTSDEISSTIPVLRNAYEGVNRFKEAGRGYVQPFKCGVELNDYYYNEALKGATSLGEHGSEFKNRLASLLDSYKAVMKVCQSIEIYFRLQDFKLDAYDRFYKFSAEFHDTNKAYIRERNLAWNTILKIFKTIQPPKSDPYHITWSLLYEQTLVEKKVLDAWPVNLNVELHTGWPVDMVKNQVLDDDKLIASLQQKLPEIKYPASSQVKAFVGGLNSLQTSKRRGIDEYTFDKQKTDGHSNDVHNNLQNYYNGVLISHFNMFIKYASGDGYRGIYLPEYATDFEIKAKEKKPALDVTPFQDIPHQPISVGQQNAVINANAFKSLSLYIDYINECVRQFKNTTPSVRTLNGYASRARKSMRERGKANITFSDKDFKVPVTLYQQTIESTKNLPPSVQASLKVQAGALNAIVTEWAQWTNILLDGSENKTLTLDSGEFVYGVLDRFHVLFEALDSRKEQLYSDIRTVYESYKPQDPSDSWSKSGKVLCRLTDLDKEQLMVAKAYYTTSPNTAADTKQIDDLVRTVIADEYSNMDGIRKLGRSNGRCPYTPYEDIPGTSRNLSERLNQLSPSDAKGNSHPYHRLVYMFNDVVDDYNKFCELSPEVKLLKHVRQLDLFEVEPPVLGDSRPPRPVPPQRTKPLVAETVAIPANENESRAVARDTIYIERRDTVYLREPSENLRSMEGYAINNLVLLLDVSGSMNAPEKLPLLKESLLNMLGMMREEDEVSVVVYSGNAKVLLQPVSFREETRIRKVINGLKSSGKTDVNAGLKLAYQVADKNYIRGGNNRIVLATDGEFPVGPASMKLIEESADQDIFISVFNFGKGTSSARTLEKLAAIGKGNYELITPENAEFKLIREVKSKRQR